MRKLFTFLFVLAFVMLAFVPHAQAKYGLVKWDYSVVDENGQAITDTITVNVYTAGSSTSATVYSSEDAASQSNPWTETDGYIVFWSSATTLDIQVNVGARGAKITSVGADDTHRITLPKQPVGIQRIVPLPLGVWYDSTGGDVIDNAEAPGSSVQNSVVAVDWADGEAAQFAAATFRVPYDYLSGGSFRVWLDTAAGDVTGTALDFAVYVNKDVTVFDSAATDQTPVVCDDNPGSPSEHTLTVGTDFASLAAGDMVTLRVWRDDTTYTGTAGLEMYYAEFVYTAKQ